jgi:dihydropteroate synthase
MENQIFKKHRSINIKGELFFFDRPEIMGILNITGDSFYDGGKYNDKDRALKRVEEMLDDGAGFIDIGAQSSRPGAQEKGADEELKLLLPVLDAVIGAFPDAVISVDTWHSKVAKEAVNHGAAMINDISGGTFDAQMFDTIAALGVPYVLMHTGGRPDVMQDNPVYDDVLNDVISFLSERLNELNLKGVSDVIIDPGFGFGKTLEHNYTLMKNLDHFAFTERPVLVGISRKSMIYRLLNIKPQEALTGTIALNTFALLKGADILRVHDVKAAAETIKIVESLM